MAVLPLCLAPHPMLRKKARPIDVFNADLRQFVTQLIETMYANDGIGLAAPQVGRDVQALEANPSQRRGKELVMVNPVLDLATGRAGVVEGCLSVPKTWERVKRAAHVRMRGQDLAGSPVVVEADGLLAIVLQHEFDHLQGHLFIDRLSWFRRCRLAITRRAKRLSCG